ncbi:coiled-coil domain-containing protein 86 [Contarinia nasturtii]|uniref:coiled-coil domain-containing protein 86 n=1 Tax=Contarinia nasturtii TaxID=265458 RepID=UPI0012D49D92|nr:coiled-coil domain-containing protein 86 [Contarinia nasturtii]
MRTRSRTASQSVAADENADVQVVNKKKTPQKQNNDALVASIISSIQEENSTKETEVKNNENSHTKTNGSKPPVQKVNAPKMIRGQPKSGRPWKDVKQRFSTIKKSMYRRPFEKKQQLREELKHIKELSKSIKQDKKLEKIEKKERREENAKRRLENERKNEIVQIIKNPAKLKRMKKKQLRKIEKRDLTASNGPKVV